MLASLCTEPPRSAAGNFTIYSRCSSREEKAGVQVIRVAIVSAFVTERYIIRIINRALVVRLRRQSGQIAGAKLDGRNNCDIS